MVTTAGTVATAVLALLSKTLAPPTGEAPVREIVPVVLLPPITVVCERDIPPRMARMTVRIVVLATPLACAVIEQFALIDTGMVVESVRLVEKTKEAV